jgi:hypothetical protein
MGLSLHPFIDKAGQQPPVPAGYRRPEDVEFEDGSTLARYMPGTAGDKRMRGVVIPHAKPLGGSRAYDPNKPPHRRVHIDPHIEGQSVVVDLEQITPDIAEEAITLGQEYADKHADELEAIEHLRLRGAAALHLIGASQRAQASTPPPPPQPGTGQVITIPQAGVPPPLASAPPAAAAAPRAIKAASFNGSTTVAQSAAAAPRGGLLDAYQKPRAQPIEVAPSATAVSPPAQKVTFGVPGFGLHEAYYHRVIIHDQQFILVYDERYQGGGKFLPQIDGPFAARVEGDPVDYKLVWPDQSFTDPDTGRTYFSLLIEERVAQESEP